MTSPAKSQTHTRHRAAFAALLIALIVTAIAFSSGGVSSQGSDPQRRDLDRVFKRHERLSLDPGQIARQVKQTRSLTLNTSRGRFEMTLEPHDMRAPGYVAEAWGDNGSVRVLDPVPVRTYKGTVQGMPEAQARLTIDEDTVEGLIITPGELFFVEPSKHFSGSAAKTDFVFYAESDLKESAGECGNTMAQMVAQHSANVSTQTSSKGPQPEALFGPVLEIGIAAEADFEYFSAWGTEAVTVGQIETILNQVEGIYDAQIGLQFQLLVTRVWTTAGDPYTSPVLPATTVDAEDALDEFRDYYNGGNAPPPAASRDIAHLFTGRNIASESNTQPSTIGIAYNPGLGCPFDAANGFGYGMSENIGTNRPVLTAHEIGHNLDASHVNATNGTDCSPSIMGPSLTSSTNFCQFSRDEITNHAITVRSCLAPLTQPGCTYSISPTLQNFPASGGSRSINVTTGASCNWGVAEGLPWISATTSSGAGSGAAVLLAPANSGGPLSGIIDIGGQSLIVTQPASANCATTPIAPGQTLNRVLEITDCRSGQPSRPNAHIDLYTFNGMAGQRIRIEMSDDASQSPTVDTFLYLFGPDGTLLAQNDDIVLGQQTNSRIPLSGFFTLPQTGTYTIEATSFDNDETGAYSLTLTSVPLLLTEQGNGSAGAALNSVTFARTSNASNTALRIFDPLNFSADKTTRVILFTSDLGLAQQQNPASNVVSVSAGGRNLVVEQVGPFSFPGLSGSYVIVSLGALNAAPQLTGNLAFTVTSNGQTSNVTTITIAP